MRAAKIQASLRIRAVSPEHPLLAHTSSESRGTFRQKARSLAPMNGWAYAVKICHDGMLEDTNSLDAAHPKCHLWTSKEIKRGLTLPGSHVCPKLVLSTYTISLPGAEARSEACPLSMQMAPSSIPTSGTFFRGDLVMKKFLRPFSLFR